MLLKSLVAASLLYFVNAQAQLERLSVNITCPNGSEFLLNHDNHDTRLYLSTPSTEGDDSKFTMVAHSRDNVLLRVDIVKWNADGIAEDHFDISDLKKPMVNQATHKVVTALESLGPDVFFLLKEMKNEGLKRSTKIRRNIPEKVRKVLPNLPLIYEHILYSALSPFFDKIEHRLPKSFEVFPKNQPQEWKKRYQKKDERKEARQYVFENVGLDKFGRPTEMSAKFGLDGVFIDIKAHLPSIVDLYNDDSYY